MMRRILTVVLLASAAVVSRAAAQRSHFGLRGGYNFDIDEGLIGAQIHMPLTRSIELYPSFDYYLVGAGTLSATPSDSARSRPAAGTSRTPAHLSACVRTPRTTPADGRGA